MECRCGFAGDASYWVSRNEAADMPSQRSQTTIARVHAPQGSYGNTQRSKPCPSFPCFWKRQGKPTKRTRIFYPYRTPRIPGREGKNAQKNKEILARRKNKEFPKNKERKDREKGSEKVLERVLGKGSQKGSEKGVCYGFYTTKRVLRRVLRRGSEKGVSRRCLERPLEEYAPLGVRPNCTQKCYKKTFCKRIFRGNCHWVMALTQKSKRSETIWFPN